jgi:hypothetical protein
LNWFGLLAISGCRLGDSIQICRSHVFTLEFPQTQVLTLWTTRERIAHVKHKFGVATVCGVEPEFIDCLSCFHDQTSGNVFAQSFPNDSPRQSGCFRYLDWSSCGQDGRLRLVGVLLERQAVSIPESAIDSVPLCPPERHDSPEEDRHRHDFASNTVVRRRTTGRLLARDRSKGDLLLLLVK